MLSAKDEPAVSTTAFLLFFCRGWRAGGFWRVLGRAGLAWQARFCFGAVWGLFGIDDGNMGHYRGSGAGSLQGDAIGLIMGLAISWFSD